LSHDELESQIESSLVSIVDSQEIDKAGLRGTIAELEAQFKELEQVDIPIKHYFSKDVYAREITIPKGAIVIGKIHKHENLNILSSGEITVVSVDGVKRMKAPCTIVSSPGVKRIAYAHTDTVWTTIHGTSETDLEKIEAEFIAKDYSEVESITEDELQKLKESLCHG
jgi:hypothetical protein